MGSASSTIRCHCPAGMQRCSVCTGCRQWPAACVQVADRATGLWLPHMQDKARGALGKGVRSASWCPGYFGLIIVGCALFKAVTWSNGESSQG